MSLTAVVNQSISIPFTLLDSLGAAETGKGNGDFTKSAYLASTPATTASPTVTENASGTYRIAFTPTAVGVWLFHVLPPLLVDNETDDRGADSEHAANAFVGFPARLINRSNLSHLSFRQFCGGTGLTPSQSIWTSARSIPITTRYTVPILSRPTRIATERSPGLNHVSHVIRVRARDEVVRVTALPVVATVANTWELGCAMRQSERNSMCANNTVVGLAPDAEMPISVRGYIPSERPALVRAARLVNLFPEAIGIVWGKLVEHRGLPPAVSRPGRLERGAGLFCCPIIPKGVAA